MSKKRKRHGNRPDALLGSTGIRAVDNPRYKEFLDEFKSHYEDGTTDYGLRPKLVDGRGKIFLYDVIDDWWGIGANMMVDALNFLGNVPIDMYVNSPGGDVWDGRAMQTLLRNHDQEVIAYVDGIAASAATTVALGANSTFIAEGARFMIHNSWTFTIGNATELRKIADLLDQIDEDIANDYAKKTGETAETMLGHMAEDTFFSAKEACEIGLCDGISNQEEEPDPEDSDNEEDVRDERENRIRMARFADMQRRL